MGKTPKLKATLRKAPAKQDNPADVTSESSEAPSSNPWASEASVRSPDSLSRQASKTLSQTQTIDSGPAAKDSDNASEKSAATAATHHSQPFENATNGSLAVPEDAPKARRKKTVTKTTPHTFELEDELKSRTQPTPETADPPKTNVSEKPPPPRSKLSSKSSLSFSPLRTTLNLHPVGAQPPSSPRPRSTATPIPNNPFSSPQRQHRKSSSIVNSPAPLSASISQPYRFIPASQPLDAGSFFNKVVVITHGSSLISANVIRQFHSAGARVIFGDPSPEKCRKVISSLGPPDTVHYNRCDVSKYEDIVDLFKLAVTMYGRVDHAIFGLGDDGSVGRGVGESEKLWGLDFGNKGRNTLGKEVLAEVEKEKDNEGARMTDLIGTGVRFARVAMAYLKHTPKGAKSKRRTMTGSTNGNTDEKDPRVDRSLTFLTSTASIKGVPYLMVYQVACHTILGIVRSLSSSLDLERDGIRVNAVLTNVMIPTAKTMIGGRMSVQLPVGRVEDVARIVTGVVGDGSVVSSESGGGVHGKVLYVTGDEAVDLEDGMRRSEKVWMGEKGKESLERAEEGWTGGGVEWMLMDGLD